MKSCVLKSTQTVHPRACGEHTRIRQWAVSSRGSSPRLRGTLERCFLEVKFQRFIPAPAGNTQSMSSGWASQSVHPRACGEHTVSLTLTLGYSGSSPRLRGTLRGAGAEYIPFRFIPAPAGNTSSATLRAPPTGGSSPRLRGTQVEMPTITAPGRFIPAPAGNTRHGTISVAVMTVHPRACGEHTSPSPTTARTCGSSPRLRGTRMGESRNEPL